MHAAQCVMNAYVNVKDYHGNTSLYYEAQSGNIAQVKQLLSIGALVNAQNKDGHTPLFAAVNFAHVLYGNAQKNEIIKILLNNGADVNLDNDGNGNLLDSTWCNYETCKLLLKKGIQPSQKFLNKLVDRMNKVTACVEIRPRIMDINGEMYTDHLDKDGRYKAELADLTEIKQLCETNLKAAQK